MQTFINFMAWMGFTYSALLFIVLAYNFASIIKEDKTKSNNETNQSSIPRKGSR